MNDHKEEIMTEHKRFWEKVEKSNNDCCWLWTASKNHGGYGQFWVRNTFIRAHRYAYELSYGPIPEGKLCLHKCDIQGCVNPNHLYLGTQSDNMYDKCDRSTFDRKLCGHPKFYDEDLKFIRELGTRVPQKQLARMYISNQGAISRIINNLCYPTKGSCFSYSKL